MKRVHLGIVGAWLVSLALMAVPGSSLRADHLDHVDGTYFTLDNGINLREIADKQTRGMLKRVTGEGEDFGAAQRTRYCKLKAETAPIQWVVNNLDTGEVLARSRNAEQLYFGASVSKVFVAAALLDKQQGRLSQKQLRQLTLMIVVSDNVTWLDLQRQVGGDGTNDTGRTAVQAFVRRMGYPTIKGFQGWNGRRNGVGGEHGNELNALELSQFLFDTRHRNYRGADVLWKIMQATKTGDRKIDKYTPASLYLGGKTGTYSGSNEAPETVHLPTIKARNHAAVLLIGDGHFGISILSNTGDNEDVAVLGGGLMREFLGVDGGLTCG